MWLEVQLILDLVYSMVEEEYTGRLLHIITSLIFFHYAYGGWLGLLIVFGYLLSLWGPVRLLDAYFMFFKLFTSTSRNCQALADFSICNPFFLTFDVYSHFIMLLSYLISVNL